MKYLIIFIAAWVSTIRSQKFDMNFDKEKFDQYLSSGTFKGFLTPKQFWNFYRVVKESPAYSNLISDRESIGQTIKRNHIYGFYLCDDISKLETYKKTKNIITLTALHHAREPLSITMIVLMVSKILRSFNESKHNKMKELLRDNIIFFVPILNIDSYLYIINSYRKDPTNKEVLMIRKNRNIDKKCGAMTGGVDLNRNYGFKFGLDNKGSSNDPCAEDYRGEHPFSENETIAIKDYIEAHDNVVSCVNVHTYGNAWIYPFNYINDRSNNLLKVH